MTGTWATSENLHGRGGEGGEGGKTGENSEGVSGGDIVEDASGRQKVDGTERQTKEREKTKYITE